ncbi:hypothetical protein CDL15_Pgr005471 [Punica granatum]|nr:hypothetical protein CDL15_Pgr005471 [Punica granatum]
MEVSECCVGVGYCGAGGADFYPEKKAGEQFTVDDLLDFSNEDVMGSGDGGFLDNVGANSADSSTATAVDSCNSTLSGGDNQFSGSFGSRSFGDSSFSGELCVPYDDLAELEWLSNFVEDSFSTKHNLQQPLHIITVPNSKPTTPESSSSDAPAAGPEQPSDAAQHHAIFLPETPLPSKSRSKRSRAAPCDWTTRLLHLTPAASAAVKPPKTSALKKQREAQGPTEPRKCLHCASEKTPQWRTGPMGPKTLCNACGVRYKSGRLVPEYRPAASPTFVSTRHSNSHRKVLELRRQREMQRVHQHGHHPPHQFVGQSPMFTRPGSNGVDEFLIGHCGGPGFRQLM